MLKQFKMFKLFTKMRNMPLGTWWVVGGCGYNGPQLQMRTCHEVSRFW